MPTEGIAPYTRRDTQHADPAHRPTKAQYDRYLWLVEHFRGLGWDNAKLHDASPFQVVDPGFNAILIRACADLADLAEALGETAIAAENRAFAARGLAAMESLWSEAHGQYLCRDRVTGALIDSASVGGLLARLRRRSRPRAPRRSPRTIDRLAGKRALPRAEPRPRRPALRRPALLARPGLAGGQLHDRRRPARRRARPRPPRRIAASSLELIRESGFAEYYDPLTGAAARRRHLHLDRGDGARVPAAGRAAA